MTTKAHSGILQDKGKKKKLDLSTVPHNLNGIFTNR